MDLPKTIRVIALFTIFSTCSGFHHYWTNPEKITDYQQFSKNFTENGNQLQILEHTITPYDVSPEQLKLIGRYVFLAPKENNVYLVGFERTIDKSEEASRIINELISSNVVTSIYKVRRQEPSSFRLEKFVTIG
ncbi:hypothetical protein quinque_001374 [Culex quinquefasciatus]|uniref:uncharacterized protein LOC119769974 n=1 Tax=Culex quinquefasciatus TaxID=7176 RepID=UPI0018E32681|nr:uncharacterized protein LOC119769974 [Culex quinquefasciatus]